MSETQRPLSTRLITVAMKFDLPKKGGRPAVLRSRPRGDGYTFGGGRYAMRQTHVPAAFALVHLQDHAGIAGRMVERSVHQKKIRPQLFHENGTAVDQQPHFYLGGVPALTR